MISKVKILRVTRKTGFPNKKLNKKANRKPLKVKSILLYPENPLYLKILLYEILQSPSLHLFLFFFFNPYDHVIIPPTLRR